MNKSITIENCENSTIYGNSNQSENNAAAGEENVKDKFSKEEYIEINDTVPLLQHDDDPGKWHNVILDTEKIFLVFAKILKKC